MVSAFAALVIALGMTPGPLPCTHLQAEKEVPELPRLPDAPGEAALRVRAGRASLVRGAEVAVLTRASGVQAVLGAAYVEIGPGGEIELSWPGAASLRVTGPAALEWSGGDAETLGGTVRVFRFRTLEAEVRRGSRELVLPQGWTLGVARAALHATACPSGEVEILHRGGTDVTAQERGGRVALRVASGERRRLRPRN